MRRVTDILAQCCHSAVRSIRHASSSHGRLCHSSKFERLKNGPHAQYAVYIYQTDVLYTAGFSSFEPHTTFFMHSGLRCCIRSPHRCHVCLHARDPWPLRY
ncbi:unnamed protein product [Chondrus crispus]|uniref:Uncharacterized protein n=1 Tax=Chondrus crispus TaxID=2769 RepID=R7QEH4_CHOCR|nr:unnamed protein product [Chondrus crispus]CDF35830.1 unnamed protein product [Chondrus crispus]|eukprot:XP_005715649.1 unnamed protein product [Chondrus crispus]